MCGARHADVQYGHLSVPREMDGVTFTRDGNEPRAREEQLRTARSTVAPGSSRMIATRPPQIDPAHGTKICHKSDASRWCITLSPLHSRQSTGHSRPHQQKHSESKIDVIITMVTSPETSAACNMIVAAATIGVGDS